MAIATIIGILVGAVVLRFGLPAGTPRIRSQRTRGAGRSVAVLERVRVGESNQWVVERGEDRQNPIVLFLHGGPGTSQLTSNRRATRALERFFVVVNWDQRGAGKSFAAGEDVRRMTIDRFVEDTRELTCYLLKKFKQERLVLAGHSWGSVIGAMAAHKYPELYYCYVGIGQLATMAESETVSYEWTLNQARERHHHQAVKALESIGRPPYDGNWQAKTLTQRRYLARFGGEVHGSRVGALRMVLAGVLFSREYTLADRLNVFRGALRSMKLLWPELLTVDLVTTTRRFAVPILFAEGRFDRECPSDLAARYFDVIEAPHKELVWFEQSAHMVNFEERDAFNRFMIERVLPLVRSPLSASQ